MIEAEQRPTCETCPYWDQFATNLYVGICRRHAPVAVMVSLAQTENDDAEINPDPTFPCVTAEEWCGEHPDMPEWIARRRISTNGTPRQQDA